VEIENPWANDLRQKFGIRQGVLGCLWVAAGVSSQC
jgi:hypothetical protein